LLTNNERYQLLYEWLQPFLHALKEEGRIPISPDTHLQVIRVLQAYGSQVTRHNVLDYIAPVIAKHSEHRKILEERYDKFISVEEETEADDERKKQEKLEKENARQKKIRQQALRKRYLIAGSAILILIAAISIIRFWPKPVSHASARISISSATVGQPVYFDASPGLENLSDTQHIQFSWDFGDGTQYKGSYQTQHTYSQPGRYKIALQLSSRSTSVRIDSADASIRIEGGSSEQLTVCPAADVIKEDTGNVEPMQTARFIFTYDQRFPPKEQKWFVNDTLIRNNSDTLEHRFIYAGQYSIRVTTDDSLCGNNLTYDLSVAYPKTNYALSFRETGPPPVVHTSRLRSGWIAALALLAIVPIAGMVWLRQRLNRKERTSRLKAQTIINRFGGTAQPYEIPFKNHDELIEDEKELLDVARSYKRRNADEVAYLDIPRTINATINSEGLIAPVWSSKTRPVEYLMLIDRNKAKSQQVRLFEYLVRRFSRNDLYLEKFYYHFDPDTCFNNSYPNGIHLSRLKDLYPNHIVVVFGNGYQLIDRHYPSLNEQIVGLFRKWEQWAICTPVNFSDWGYKEKILQQATVLLPADLHGQLLLFKLLENRNIRYQDMLAEAKDYQSKNVNFNDVAQLRAYLGDPFLFQWVCALAIYPRIRWEVLIAMGDALQKNNYSGNEVTYSALLKIVRIKWMQDGSFPDMTRLELLKQLEPRNEKVARETMIRLMDEASIRMDQTSFSFEEVQTQQLTDKFVLYSHDPSHTQYNQYESAHNEFRVLWEQGKIIDYPLSTYLRKSGNGSDWSTLVGNKELSNEPVASKPMDVFFEDNLDATRKIVAKTRKGLMGASIVAATLLILLVATKDSIQGSGMDKLLQLTASTTKNNPVTLHIGLNECLTLEQLRNDSARVIVELPGNRTVQLNAGDTLVQFDIDYPSNTDSLSKVTLVSRNENYNISTSYKINGSDIRMNVIGCPVTAPGNCRWMTMNSLLLTDFTGAWYDASILDASQSSYTPLYIEPANGSTPGKIDDKEIVEMYRCQGDNKNTKAILRDKKNSYQVAYLQQDAPTSLKIGFIDTKYQRIGAARNDTTRPVLQEKIFFPLYIDSLATNYNLEEGLINVFNGDWASGKDTMSFRPNQKLQAMSTSRGVYDIGDIARAKTPVPVYMSGITTRIKQPSRRLPEKYLIYFFPAGNKMLVNAELVELKTAINPLVNPAEKLGRLKTFSPISIKSTGEDEFVVNLPTSLNEIWYGEVTGRYLNINLQQKVIYRSLGSRNSIDRFDIDKVYLTGPGSYKIVSKPNQYGSQVYFISNVTDNSFYFSGCPNRYTSTQQIKSLTEKDCSNPSKMNLYYETNSKVVYLPATPGTILQSSEQAKVNILLNQNSSNALYNLKLIYNKEYLSQPSRSSLGLEELLPLSRRILPKGWANQLTTDPMTTQNPFDRNYITIDVQSSPTKDDDGGVKLADTYTTIYKESDWIGRKNSNMFYKNIKISLDNINLKGNSANMSIALDGKTVDKFEVRTKESITRLINNGQYRITITLLQIVDEIKSDGLQEVFYSIMIDRRNLPASAK
jgi:hypothetical protein